MEAVETSGSSVVLERPHSPLGLGIGFGKFSLSTHSDGLMETTQHIGDSLIGDEVPTSSGSNVLEDCLRTLESRMKMEQSNMTLLGKWNLYYHLPQNKSWDLSSYELIMGDIDTAEKLVAIVEELPVNVMKYCMLFVMRKGVTPMWEDPKNRNGGFFSYKVANKFVPDVWKTLFYALCGETLSTNPKYSHLINGITVSPKKSFCIVKIWLTDLSMQDGDVIIDVPNLTKHGVAFKPHKPEF